MGDVDLLAFSGGLGTDTYSGMARL